MSISERTIRHDDTPQLQDHALQQSHASEPADAPGPETPWIVNWRRTAGAEATLVAFPHAGGTASMVRPWLARLPARLNLAAIQYPGRETRYGEPAYDRADPLADAIAAAIRSSLTGRLYLFGHSLGALLAFLVARKLGGSSDPAVAHLIVAGRRAPQLKDPFEPAHALPRDAFIARLKRLNGTPAAIFEHPDLVEMLLPMLRADFAVSETYRHVDPAPVTCPVTALGGLSDPMATPAELQAWSEQAPHGFSLHLFDGEHFFIRSAQTEVIDRITAIADGRAPDEAGSGRNAV